MKTEEKGQNEASNTETKTNQDRRRLASWTNNLNQLEKKSITKFQHELAS